MTASRSLSFCRFSPLVDAVGELRLSLRQHSDHRLKAGSGIGLGARQLRHGGFVAAPISLRTPKENRDRDAATASDENYGQGGDPSAFGHDVRLT